MLAINQTSNSTSFKQVNIIRVSKSAFGNTCKHPNKDVFDSIWFKHKLNDNGIKTMSISPRFTKEDGTGTDAIYSAEDVRGIRFTDIPLKENFYTFCVLTGEEKDQFFKHFTPDLEFTDMLNDPKRKQESAIDLLGSIFAYDVEHPISFEKLDEFTNTVREIVASKKPSEFTINNFDELSTLKPKLGLSKKTSKPTINSLDESGTLNSELGLSEKLSKFVINSFDKLKSKLGL